MSDQVTSFRRWLGLSQQQPDYFQLLGVERSEQRPAELRAAAEARLALLKSFQDPEGHIVRKTLAEQIKLAFQTLSQPEKRREYENSLGINPAALVSGVIPLALPVATPVKPLASAIESGSLPAANVRVAKPADLTQGDSLAALSQLDSKRKRRAAARPRSKLVPLLGLLLFLGGPLAVIGVVWLNSGAGRASKTLADSSAQGGKKPAMTSAEAAPAVNPQSDRNQVTAESRADPGREPAPAPTPAESDDSTTSEQNPPASGDGESMSPAEPTVPDGVASNELGAKALGRDYSSPKVKEACREIWNELRFRNLNQARTRLLVLKGTLTKPEEAAQLAALEEAIERAERFWQQIIKSCAEIRSGEIRFGDESAAFVESTDQFLILKLKGVIVRANWVFLPKDIAIGIAEQGSIADLPRWRLEKVTALLFDASDAAKNEPAIRDWLSQSAEDGHNTVALEWLLDRRLSDRTLAKPPAAPQESELKPALKKLAEKMPQKQLAQNNLAGRNAAIQELLEFTRKETDPLLRYVALERLREHAIRKADLALCRQVLESQASLYNVDVDAAMLDAANQMIAYSQSELQAELVCEAILLGSGVGWPTFTRGTIAPRKLIKAEELARKQDLRQTLERIRYLTTEK